MGGRKGFTLIEMLVVIAIIAVVSGAMIVGFGKVTKSAQRAKAQEVVSNAATALGVLYQRTNGKWPAALKQYGGADGEGKGLVPEAARELVKRGRSIMSLSLKRSGGGVAYDNSGYPTLIGVDRCGVVDPWAMAALKRSASADRTARVQSGGTVGDHVVYFAIDTDHDGITEASVGGVQVKVRASAIAWAAGADGKVAPLNERGRSDDVFSWSKGQEVQGE